MNTFSVDDRTRRYVNRSARMHQSRQSIRTPLDYNNRFDSQFESQLPPEVRTELEIPPQSINRWPARIPETEEEIQAALKWLKSQGYLQSVSAPPPSPEPAVAPQPPPVVPPAAKPAQSASRPGSGIWLWLVAMLLAIPILNGLLPRTQPQSRWVEVRRALPAVEVRKALPVVPRALPVTSQASTVSNTGWWQSIRMPDGSFIGVRYMGELPSSASLPAQGDFIGQEYSVGTTSWIWMTRPGATTPSWVDP